MIRTVVKRNLHIHNRESSENTLIQCFLNPLFNCSNKFFRNRSALDSINELKTSSPLFRFYTQPNMAILSTTSGLFDVFAFGLRFVGNSFFISNLWPANIYINPKFSLHAVNDNLQVQFTHSGNNRFRSFFITSNSEGWIFVGKFPQSNAHFFLVSFGFWFYTQRDNWFWNLYAFKEDWFCWITKSVTGFGIL